MMKNLFTIALLLVSALVFGQALRYEGFYKNAQNEPGTATYSYFKDLKTGKQIKHGAFRYRVKIKDSQKRVYRNITGEYQNGWKNGLWDYSYSTKDYNIKNDGFYYSYNVTLKANYKHGWPEGEWLYTAVIKRRQKLQGNSKLDWTPYEVVADTRVKLNYNMGELVDSLVIKRKDRLISAFMDQKGFMKGDFITVTDTSKLVIQFKDGFIIKDNNSTNDVVNQLDYYNYYKKHKSNLKAAGVTLDTSSFTVYSEIFKDNVFNNQYFNYLYIDGDRILSFVGSRNVMKIDYRGLYKRELKVYTSKEEENLIRAIFSFNINANRKADDCTKKYQASGKDIEARKKMDLAEGISAKLLAYTCVVKLYKTTLLPKDIAKKAEACNIDYKINSSQSRIEILRTLYNKAKALDVKSKANTCN